MTETSVLDSWEDAGDNDAQLDQRHRELMKQKQELARSQQLAKVAVLNQQAASSSSDLNDGTKCSAEPAQPVVRILRRPQSSGTLSEQEHSTQSKAQRQSRPKTFEERQAAYAQARERIFGEKYEPDDDDDGDKDPSALDDRPRVLLAAPTPSPYGRPPAEGMARVSSSPASVARSQNQPS